MCCVWYTFGVVAVECMILFSMDDMKVVYVVFVCVWHLCGKHGVWMVCQWFIGCVCIFCVLCDMWVRIAPYTLFA